MIALVDTDFAQIRSLRLEERRHCLDFDLLINGPYRQFHIDIENAVHVHDHIGSFRMPESGLLGGDRVLAYGKIGNVVQTFRTCNRGLCETRVHVSRRHHRARNRRGCFIGDHAADGATVLSEARQRGEKQNSGKTNQSLESGSRHCRPFLARLGTGRSVDHLCRTPTERLGGPINLRRDFRGRLTMSIYAPIEACLATCAPQAKLANAIPDQSIRQDKSTSRLSA